MSSIAIMSAVASPVNNTRNKPKKAKRGVYSSDDPTKIFEFVEQLGKGFVIYYYYLIIKNKFNVYDDI